MPQNTNLNVSPFYDDFDKSKNFHRILFRPGFSIQARELTSLQSILQSQIESMGQHFFKEGAMVIPGQIGYDLNVDCILLQSHFLGNEVELYREQLNNKTILGLTTGIKAKILYSISAEESEKNAITLYVKYIESGDTISNMSQKTFMDNEQLLTETNITFDNNLISIGTPFAQLLPSDSIYTGSSAYINQGVYFIRGHFVAVPNAYILLDQYENNPSYRVGFNISELIITPEDDPSITDNAIGSSNYSAPGAYRLSIVTSFIKKQIDEDSDMNFVELLRVNNSRIESFVDRTEYSEIERSVARRTYETNGDYVVDTFDVNPREHFDNFFNNGVYKSGITSADGNLASNDYAVLEVSPGRAYVRGYRTQTLSPTYVDTPKPRTYLTKQNQVIPFTLSQSTQVYNVYGQPRISATSIPSTTITHCYQIIRLYNDWTAVDGGISTDIIGDQIGVARCLQMEQRASDLYDLYIFDVQMFTAMNFSNSITVSDGDVLVGRTSGARGYVYDSSSTDQWVRLHQVSGNFQIGEVIEKDGIVVDTLTAIYSFEQSDIRRVVGFENPTSSDVVFAADLALTEQVHLQGATVTVDQTTNNNISGFNTIFSQDIRPGEVLTPTSTDYTGSNSILVTNIDYTDISYSNDNIKTSTNTPIFDFTNETATLDTDSTRGTVTDGEYSSNQFIRLRPSFTKKTSRDGELSIDMPKDAIKDISDESFFIKKTFITSFSSSSDGNVNSTFTILENEQFVTNVNNQNYTLSLVDVNSGDNANSWYSGTVIDLEDAIANDLVTFVFSTNNRVLTMWLNGVGGSGPGRVLKWKLNATIIVNTVTPKLKTAAKMQVITFNRTQYNNDIAVNGLQYGNLYGTRIEDQELAFALNDVYNVHAVFESTNNEDPQIPYLTLNQSKFFEPGTIVIGERSNARARVISFDNTNSRLYIVPLSSENFNVGENLEGFDESSNRLTGTIDDFDGAVNIGARNIISNYSLDPNITPYFYNTSKLVREPNVTEPKRKLTVIFDYFIHNSTGNYFNNTSYTGIDFSEIPRYKSEVNSRYLSDTLDFRPAVGESATGSGTISNPFISSCKCLDFDSRIFTSSSQNNGSTIFDIPKINQSITLDYEYYIPRQDRLYMIHDGTLKLSMGIPSENPPEADTIDNAMLLAKIQYEPYIYDTNEDITIQLNQQRRYTMEDIGNMDKRLQNVEYYTSLSLLENDARNVKSFDSDGFDRLKNGFLVDDFTDHSTSDVNNFDYKCSLDFTQGFLRPSHYTNNIALEYDETQSSNLTKHNKSNILTLPYIEVTIIDQPYASRLENVNPFNVFAFIGRIDLLPSSDDWVDIRRLPARIQTIEGNFTANRARFRTNNAGFAPIQWRSWRTAWTGIQSNETRRWNDRGRFVRRRGRRVFASNTITTTRNQVRSGNRIRIVPRIDRRSLGDRIVDSTFIPWIRSRNIEFTVERLKPRTRMFAFFDGDNVTNYITPKIIEVLKDSSINPSTNEIPFLVGETVVGISSGARFSILAPNDGFILNPYSNGTNSEELPTTYSSNTEIINIDTEALARTTNPNFFGNIQVGEVLHGLSSGAKAIVHDRRLISDTIGKLIGSFFIPNPQNDINPRWAVGTRVLRLTSSETDSRTTGTVDSAAEVEYTARGTLRTVQSNILSVRNSRVVRDTVTDSRSVSTVRENTRQVGWWDPLAQSFVIDTEGGTFITSIDVYFGSKDDVTPISIQIRTMENGYPTKDILPFSDVTIESDEIRISEDASIATKFTFPAPIYVPGSEEHCFVLFSDSNEYRVWISRMGEIDITGTRTISEQPYAGVLFKSQNASTWTADQYEDMKFRIYRAEFNTNTIGTAVFENAELGLGNDGIASLINNPITTIKPNIILSLPSQDDQSFTIGARIIQASSEASATIVDYDSTDPSLTVTDISGIFTSGSDNTFTSSQSLATLVISTITGGTFSVGDTLTGSSSEVTSIVTAYYAIGDTLPDDSTATAITVYVNYISGAYDVTNDSISEASGTVSASLTSVTYSGDSYIAYPDQTPTYRDVDKKVVIYHPNHGMNDPSNYVEIRNVQSEIDNVTLISRITTTSNSMNVTDASSFHTIINGSPISTTNPGYIQIVDSETFSSLNTTPGKDEATEAWRNTLNLLKDQTEIIKYSEIITTNNGSTITISERGVDDTTAKNWDPNSIIICYNLDGIPLTEINKLHDNIQDQTLDSYSITVTSVANDGIRGGGASISASQNIPFETITPTVQIVNFKETELSSRINTVSSSSIGSGIIDQPSFMNTEVYDEVQLNEENYYNNPRMICSKVNETYHLEDNKSLTLRLNLRSQNDNLSPIIDLDRISIITTSNRINRWFGGQQLLGLRSEIDPLAEVSLLPSGDQNEAIYLTKIARLSNISRSIRIFFALFKIGTSNVKLYYRTQPPGSEVSMNEIGFVNVENPEIGNTNMIEEEWEDFEYTINTNDFQSFQIKIVMQSNNQAEVPLIRDLRIIAFAS